jgi:hypothetical protein
LCAHGYRELEHTAGTLIASLVGMLGLPRKFAAVSLFVLGLGGCSSDDGFTADVGGTYTVAITNEDSTCPFDNWVVGKETTGVGLTITQDGQKIHGTLDGITGAFFALAFGSANFDGTIKGKSLTLNNYGNRSQSMGNCSYTYNATVEGTQTGDNISGTITYSAATNDNPDCAAVECSASQNFNGSRPPK